MVADLLFVCSKREEDQQEVICATGTNGGLRQMWS